MVDWGRRVVIFYYTNFYKWLVNKSFMGKDKRTIELLANDSDDAIELKELLLEKGLNVNHIYGGSSVPILIENGNYFVGKGNITAQYFPK